MQPSFCDRCHAKLEPDDEVIQAVQMVGASAFGDEMKRTVAGPTALVHVRHFPPDARRTRLSTAPRTSTSSRVKPSTAPKGSSCRVAG